MAEQAKANIERWPLYTPVAMGVGAAAYFSLRTEPPIAFAAGLAAVAIAATLALAAWGRSRAAVVVLTLLAFAAAGFALSSVRTHLVAGPVAPADMRPATACRCGSWLC